MTQRLAILTTLINPKVIEVMVEAAQAEAKQHGMQIIIVQKTVGCLDMPVIAQALFKDQEVDGVVILGAVAQGETKHDELVVNMMTDHIINLSLQYSKPVGFAVIGPGAKAHHFMPRADEYARRAVQAVVTNLEILNK